MKQFRFPEPENTKIVPESYVFDQIGMNYKLYCINEAVMIKEYLVGGMTKDKNHYNKNAVGYLYDYVLKLDEIFPNIKIPLKAKIIIWWKYWNAQKVCRFSNKPKVKKITVFGAIVFVLTPLINLIKG